MDNENVCQIYAYSCPSWDYFERGLCGECTKEFPCRHIGISARLEEYVLKVEENVSNNPYPEFIKLKSRIDFCIMHYQLIVQTAFSATTAQGKLLIRIESSSKNVHEEEVEKFMPGKNFTRLVTRDPDDGDLFNVKIEISWIPDVGFENISIDINMIQFRYMSHSDEA
jgi:hypothetical protein